MPETILQRSLALLLAWCLWSSGAAASDLLLTNPRFSWDERFITFDYCDPQCKIVISSLDIKKATMLSPEGETWINPSFDPVSDRLVFIRSRADQITGVDVQVAMSNRDGTQLSILTRTPSAKRHPSFSFDGKQIIFWAKDPSPLKAGPRFVLADAYAIDVQTKVERRLTDLRVHDMSAPFFLADARHLAFSTTGSARPRSNRAGPIPLDKLYPNRTMFVLPVDGPQSLAPFVTTTPTAAAPMPLEDGTLAFLVRVNEYDGVREGYVYDVFVTKGSQVKRHTSLRSYVRAYGISRTGRYVAFATGNPRNGVVGQIVVWDARMSRAVPLNLGNLTVIRISMKRNVPSAFAMAKAHN